MLTALPPTVYRNCSVPLQSWIKYFNITVTSSMLPYPEDLGEFNGSFVPHSSIISSTLMTSACFDRNMDFG